jgi:hypothetical protein
MCILEQTFDYSAKKKQKYSQSLSFHYFSPTKKLKAVVLYDFQSDIREDIVLHP